MTFANLASKVAFSEGRKSQTSIGDIREILSILSDLLYSDPEVLLCLLENGKRKRRK
jgi:hypothetical protein